MLRCLLVYVTQQNDGVEAEVQMEIVSLSMKTIEFLGSVNDLANTKKLLFLAC